MPRKVIDLAGQKFEMLTVLERDGSIDNRAAWKCKCDCGNVNTYRAAVLRSNLQRSCGCLRRKKKHAGVDIPEYQSWKGMKQRCNNPRHKQFHDYGGRGITVCAKWEKSFDQFFKDVGPKPEAGYTIDRINNDIGYEPGNCRWATRLEQSANKRPKN